MCVVVAVRARGLTRDTTRIAPLPLGGPAAPDQWEPEEEWLRNYMRNVKMHRG